MKVALYSRVSTERQDPENQVQALRDWANREGHIVVAEYQDIASGVKRRERLEDLLEEARARRFEVVAIWALDRLTREGTLAMLLQLNRLHQAGIRVYSHQEPYLDPASPFYDVAVAMAATIARYERERMIARTQEGLERARREGKRLGRPPGKKDAAPRKKSGYYRRWELQGKNGSAPKAGRKSE